MFENKFLDFFSRIHFSSVPILFVPITGYFIYRAAFMFEVQWLTLAGLLFAGYFFCRNRLLSAGWEMPSMRAAMVWLPSARLTASSINSSRASCRVGSCSSP